MSHSMRTAILSTVASASLFAACASSPPPTARMASAEASVRAVRDLGAEQVPNAEIELRRAQGQIDAARQLSKKGDNEAADIMLQRASADAELANAYVQESQALARQQAALERAGMPTSGAPGYPQSPGTP